VAKNKDGKDVPQSVQEELIGHDTALNDGKPMTSADLDENSESKLPLASEFFEDPKETNPPAGVDELLEFVHTDGRELPHPEETGDAPTRGKVQVGDAVRYCTGYEDSGLKDETGNRIMQPAYAPATVYDVDKKRTATQHVLLVFESTNNGLQPAWAHQAEANPGYWDYLPNEG
jgi:hypothetical protein